MRWLPLIVCLLLSFIGGAVAQQIYVEQFGNATAGHLVCVAANFMFQDCANYASVIQFGGASSFSANGVVATTLGSVGPTGSHTSVQKWLTIKDNSGNTLYIPAF